MHVPIKSGPVPHPVWRPMGTCWRWNRASAPATQQGKLDASICRSVRVPIKTMYYVIAHTTEPANVNKPVGIVQVLQGSKSLLWSYYHYENEKSTRDPVNVVLEPGVNYKVCFTGRRQTFDLCMLDLYACQTEAMCVQERDHFGKLSMSRRSR